MAQLNLFQPQAKSEQLIRSLEILQQLSSPGFPERLVDGELDLLEQLATHVADAYDGRFETVDGDDTYALLVFGESDAPTAYVLHKNNQQVFALSFEDEQSISSGGTLNAQQILFDALKEDLSTKLEFHV